MGAALFPSGLGEIADRFEGFIIDQWGVIHDGQQLFPAATDVLRELKARGKRIVLLSNSGRRAAFNRRRLAEMGLDLGLLDAVVTSGEAAWQALHRRTEPPFDTLGRRCLLFTIGGDLGVVDGLGLELVDDPERADFVFATGLEIPPRTLDDYRRLVEPAAARGVPMICSNPDKVAPVGDRLAISPGTIAQVYEELGGSVRYLGKPYQPIYAACFEALAGIRRERIVAVGDSMEHDVKGANDAGIAACFVLGGIHAADFPAGAGRVEHAREVERLALRYGARPDLVLERFVW